LEKKILTLTIIHDNNKILLGMKKRGYAAGRWNGFGGKLIPGESIEEGMLRELNEESSLMATDYEKIGVLTFESEDEDYISEVHLFKINKYNGVAVETEEMRPMWFAFENIPYSEMWPDDAIWLPLVLEGHKVQGSIFFKDNNTIKSHNIKSVAEIS
jgi:8-oxo-dGTP diphosphatase/2-hydroxy-dATP diphosphatase